MESVYFPPGKAGNVLRGALGTTLRSGDMERSDLGRSDLERQPDSVKPSGLADPPRPFVLRAAHLDGKRFLPGETFSLDVHVFDLRQPLREIFVSAFSEWARIGLGRAGPRGTTWGRGRRNLHKHKPHGWTGGVQMLPVISHADRAERQFVP